ncbi:MAG: pantetheine-phosphate adenylyltransferase [Paludibacteraceae bacterium]
MKKRIAIFPGSFNPFTRGHQRIVERGLKLFDTIIIAIGRNSEKQAEQSEEERALQITELYSKNPRVSVQTYETLTVDFAKQVGADFILRGVRTMKDFDYELQMADVNRLLTGIETVVLFAETDKVNISSSLVRELQAFGKDITDFLPETK